MSKLGDNDCIMLWLKCHHQNNSWLLFFKDPMYFPSRFHVTIHWQIALKQRWFNQCVTRGLFIFIKGANHFGPDCMWVHTEITEDSLAYSVHMFTICCNPWQGGLQFERGARGLLQRQTWWWATGCLLWWSSARTKTQPLWKRSAQGPGSIRKKCLICC